MQVTKDAQEALGIYDEWLRTHRVDLHNTLRDMAAKEVNGKMPAIHLRSRVASVVSIYFNSPRVSRLLIEMIDRILRLEW